MRALAWLGLVGIILSGCQSTPVVLLDDQRLVVEVADSPDTQTQGLSNRPSLPENTGMIFIFNEYRRRNFWMKEMQFPIDMIWISDTRVVGIEKNVPTPTSSQLLIYTSPEAVNYVVEVNAGWADRHGISVGSSFRLLN